MTGDPAGDGPSPAFRWTCRRCGHGWKVAAPHQARVRCPQCHLRQRVSQPDIPDRRRHPAPPAAARPAGPAPPPAAPIAPAPAQHAAPPDPPRRVPPVGAWLAARGMDYDQRAAAAGRCGIIRCRRPHTHLWHAETLPQPAEGLVKVCGPHFGVLQRLAAAEPQA